MYMIFGISVICFLIPKSYIIVNLVGKLLHQNDKQNEIKKLKKELSGISISSEYTKYVKIERQIFALESSRPKLSVLSNSYLLNQAVMVILNTCLAILSITQRNDVFMSFEKRYNFSSLDKISTFPVGCSNGISVLVWIIINKYVAKTIYSISK